MFDVHGNVPVATGTRKPTDELSRPRGCEVEVVEGASSVLKNKAAANGTNKNKFRA